MPLTTYADEKVLNALMQAASLGAPATWYVGIIGAPTWAASTAYSAGNYVVPTNFNSLAGSTGRIFKCTTAGTSGSTQPTWPTTAGGTVTDGGVTWTEVSNLFEQGTFTGAELAGGGYARVAVTANATNWGNATSAQPSASTNSTAINFASPSATWAQAVAVILADAASAGNIWAWGALTSEVTAGAGSSPSFAASSLTLTLE